MDQFEKLVKEQNEQAFEEIFDQSLKEMKDLIDQANRPIPSLFSATCNIL